MTSAKFLGVALLDLAAPPLLRRRQEDLHCFRTDSLGPFEPGCRSAGSRYVRASLHGSLLRADFRKGSRSRKPMVGAMITVGNRFATRGRRDWSPDVDNSRAEA